MPPPLYLMQGQEERQLQRGRDLQAGRSGLPTPQVRVPRPAPPRPARRPVRPRALPTASSSSSSSSRYAHSSPQQHTSACLPYLTPLLQDHHVSQDYEGGGRGGAPRRRRAERRLGGEHGLRRQAPTAAVRLNGRVPPLVAGARVHAGLPQRALILCLDLLCCCCRRCCCSAAGVHAQDACLQAAEDCVEGLSRPAWIKASSHRCRCRCRCRCR